MKMQVKLMPSCDLCGIPLEGKDIRPARLAMELRSHCLALRDAIANLDMTRELNDQTMLNETLLAIDPDEARRTVDEFCMSQMYQESPATSKSDLQMEVDDAGEEAQSMKEAHSTHSSVQLFSSLASREEQMVVDEQKCPPAEHSTSPPPASKSNTKKTKTTRSTATRQQDDNCPLQSENVVFGEPHYQFFSKKPSKTYLHATKRERSESLQQPMKLDGEYSLTQHLLDEGAPNSPKNIKPSMVNDGQPAALPVKPSDFEPWASNVPSNGNKRETRKKPSASSAERPKKSVSYRKAQVSLGGALDDSIALASASTVTRSRSLSAPSTRHSTGKNKKGERPLQVACIVGDIDVIERLLKKGENPNVADNAGWTPLHEAAFKEYPQVVRLLVEHGALIDVPGYDCQTALHRAVVGDSAESAEVLIKAGADCHTRDIYGKTPLDLAKSDRMRQLLENGRPRDALVSAAPKLPEDWAPASKAHGVCVVFSTKVSQELISRGGKFLKKRNSHIADSIDEHTTHLICRIDSNRRIARSTKVVEAILRGIWIVSEEWLEMSIAQGSFLEEEQFEAVGLILHEQCIGDGGIAKARRAKMHMAFNALSIDITYVTPFLSKKEQFQLPGLFRGCQFHIFGNPRRYQVPGCATKDLMERLIKLGEGQLLSREPNIDSWKLNPVLPYYATRDSASGREFAECGQFLVYMPGERMPPKRVFDSPVNFITPMWFLDSISKFELVHPDTRPVFNPSSSW